MHNTRIELTDSTLDIAMKLGEGNPGALAAIVDIMSNSSEVDPDGVFGNLTHALLLDTFGIYGGDIYILHSDICNRDIVKTIAVIRACQLGLFDRNILKDACNRQDRSGKVMIPVDALYAKVKEELPNFM